MDGHLEHVPDNSLVQCQDCQAHFQTTPSGDVQGAACPSCGGIRLYRSQPSPTQSDGALRNMVDMDVGGKDRGTGDGFGVGVLGKTALSFCPDCHQPWGNDPSCPSCGTLVPNTNSQHPDLAKGTPGDSLNQGVIMGNDGERPIEKRDNFMHSHMGNQLYPNLPCKNCGKGQMTGWDDKAKRSVCDNCGAPSGPPRPADDDPFARFDRQTRVAYPGEAPMLYEHTDIPEGMSANDYKKRPPLDRCPMCNMAGHPFGLNYHVQQEHPDYMNGRMARKGDASVTERVEPMRPPSLNMEPYAPLWHESYTKEAFDPMGLVKGVGEAGLAALAPVDQEIPGLDVASDAAVADEAGGLVSGIGGLMKGVMGNPVVKGLAGAHMLDSAGQEAGNLLGGGAAAGGGGGMSPDSIQPVQPANMQQFGSTDIPFLLMAEMETPHSVKSIDEQHDDPEDQDQKEFNDGDKNPSNMENPNNEDSGASGEDGVRQDTPGYGFGPNSPGLERAEMLLPLLLHYFENGGGGDQDPLIRGLHEALEQESPGYMDHEDPNSQGAIMQLLQEHKNPKPPHGAKTAIVAPGSGTMPSGLPVAPTPQPAGTPQAMPMGQGQQQGQIGAPCANCGAQTQGGACPQCGAQGGQSMGMGQPGMLAHTANTVGPQTPEQQAAVIQLLIEQGRVGEVPNVELHPEQYAKELAEITQNPNVAPLVDPSAQPQPAPMPPPPGGQPGSMPVMDPSQPGGGGGQPMQPMSKRADANNSLKRCPECNSATTSIEGIGDNTGDGTSAYAKCHSCHHTWTLTTTSKVHWAEVPNPLLAPPQDHGQESTLSWQDVSGQQLQKNATYDLQSPNAAIPDRVRVTYVHPHEVGLQLADGFESGGTEPDFKISLDQAQKYQFTPVSETADQPAPNPNGGMPGLEQIPQSGQTTDEHAQSYPNTSVASILASNEVEPNEDMCHKCGGDWIDHTYSSASTMMHECARCGTIWETRDDFEGKESSVDLDWVLHDSGPEDFYGEMERTRAMANSGRGGQSRSLSAAVARDSRYQQVQEILSGNKQQRTAGRHYTPGEQRALINERGRARNLDDLDLANTHYEARYDHTGKANGMNVPDGHLVFGL